MNGGEIDFIFVSLRSGLSRGGCKLWVRDMLEESLLGKNFFVVENIFFLGMEILVLGY